MVRLVVCGLCRPQNQGKQNKHPKKQGVVDTLDAFESVVEEAVSAFDAFDIDDDAFDTEFEVEEMPEFEFGEEFEFQ